MELEGKRMKDRTQEPLGKDPGGGVRDIELGHPQPYEDRTQEPLGKDPWSLGP